MTLHITPFEGAGALSSFRVGQLLPRLQTLCPSLQSLGARHVHLVATVAAPDAAAQQRLAALLNYGEPAAAAPASAFTTTLIVTPRVGTVSPWASKATDIAHNCGLALRRIERITEDQLGSSAPLTAEQVQALAALLHDRMTESVLSTREDALALFTELPAAPLEQVDLQSGDASTRRAALSMFPGKELAYDIIYRPRLQRLINERFRLQ